MSFFSKGKRRSILNPLLSIKHFIVFMLISLHLVGCKEEIPPLPVEPTATQAVIYYNREDGNYQDWGLHLWDAAGAAFTPDEFINETGSTDWAKPKLPDGINDDYGAYFVINFEDENWTGFRFIMHKGDDKDLGGVDHYFERSVFGNDLFTFSGNGELFPDPITEAPVNINNASAHWLTKNILIVESAQTPELIHSATADIEIDPQSNTIQGGEKIALTAVEFPAELKAQYPHLAHFNAWQLPEGLDTKSLLKQQLIVALSSEEKLKAATQVQLAGVLDSIYAESAAELDLFPNLQTNQGQTRVWAPTAQSVDLVLYDAVNEYQLERVSTLPMAFDTETGSWSVTSDQIQQGRYYRYLVEVYHPLTRKIETYEVADPYSISSSTNSEYSQFIDLTSEQVTPENWETITDHQVAAAEQISIYEIHVRDLTHSDQQGSSELNGKYLAVQESERASIQHLHDLKQAGLTHIHLLPAFDIASVNENKSERVEITNTIRSYCDKYSGSPLCINNTGNLDETFEDRLKQCDPTTPCAQELMSYIRGLDGFNWGYDPVLYSVPDGSYATNPMGEARILEFRKMVKHFQEMGFSVVMDVVYNHTNASGLSSYSILDKIVPGYYHRLNPTSGAVENSTCCDNTASENKMMEKLMIDSLVLWAKEYKIDGFRFDLMGHHTKENIVKAYNQVADSVDHFIYFYGEGWNFGEVQNDSRFVQATQGNMAGTGIGSFSDRIRDSLRGGGPFDSGEGLRTSQGFTTGLYTNPNELNSGSESEKTTLLQESDVIRLGLAGNLKDYLLISSNDKIVRGEDLNYKGQAAGYTDDPQEVINYVSKHDNQTLWDNNQYKLPADQTMEQRVKAQNLAINTILLSQGIPFIHMGADILRSKSMERDSYDSGDWYNKVDFSMETSNWNTGLPREDKDAANWDMINEIVANSLIQPNKLTKSLASNNFKEFLEIRSSSPLFQLQTKEDVLKRVDFHNTGAEQLPGVIVGSIDDGIRTRVDLDPNFDAIVYVINGRPETIKFEDVKGVSRFEVHPLLQDGNKDGIDSDILEASFRGLVVPGQSVGVFVIPQKDRQGAGLPVTEKKETANELSADVYIRGSLYGEGWPADTGNLFNKVGETLYQATIEIAAGDHQFKIASEDWNTHNWGMTGATLDVPGSIELSDTENDNLSISISETAEYQFNLDISNLERPILSVRKLETDACVEMPDSSESGPLGDTKLYVRGDHSGWQPDATYELKYKGNNTYQAVFSFSGTMNFKVADGSDSWDVQYFVSQNDVVGLLEPDVNYRAMRGNAGVDNNQLQLPADTWSIKLKIDDPIVLAGEAADYIVESCTPL